MNDTLILLPTYNESDNIEPLIQKIFGVLPDARVLVVDDSSPDGTADIVRRMMKGDTRINLLQRARKEGLGRAYQAAFLEGLKDPSNKIFIMMDADFSHDPVYIPEMIRMAESADIVIGSRYCSGGSTEGWTLWRRVLSAGANKYCRLVSGMPIADATAGFVLIKADILRSANISSLGFSGYAFIMELKHHLWQRGARLAEVPILFKERREGESKISNHIILEGVLAPWKMRLKKTK